MGLRTVVVLANDLASEWMNDPELGKKIMHAAAVASYGAGGRSDARSILPYGHIVEQVHGDTQTVAFLDGYSGKAMAYSNWHRGQTTEQKELEMLKALAEKLGYRVSKIPAKKA